MKISPRELREAQIPSKAFGFNQDVVDALLERAADTIEGLIEENRQLFEALERMRSEGVSAPISDPFQDVEMQSVDPSLTEVVAPAANIEVDQVRNTEKEDLINKTLLLAQRTADETLKTAKDQAAEFVEIAQAKADELVKKASLDAENLTGQAQEQAQADLAAAKQEAESLVTSAQTRADELVAAAQAQADAIHEGEREKFVALVAQLTQERAQLVSDIEILQTFDKEHRTKLRKIVEEDLQHLQEREHLDIGSLPELPKVDLIAPIAPASAPAVESEVVAHSEMSAPESFDEMINVAPPVVEPASESDADDDIVLGEGVVVDSYETRDLSGAGNGLNFDADPFASFVDSPSVVEPAGGEEVLDAQIVEPAGGQVESSSSTGTFDPGAQGKSSHAKLDDDDFFASLREAVQDDAPLGPSDEDEDGGNSKGIFKR